MKINLPVTLNEIVLTQDDSIVTKTDAKGIITYANDDFCRISGFSREELIGKNHNLVRHPDMPPEAFADLWTTVKAGLPWTGLVKNRTKSGDFYWVEAHVAPQMVNGEVAEIVSSRTQPAREEVAAASAVYANLKAGGKRYFINQGAAYRNTFWVRFISLPFRKLSLLGKSLISISTFALAFALFAYFAFGALNMVKVSGPVYNKIVANKDLVADILPPPEYLIESWSSALEMEHASPTELKRLIDESKKLAADFDERYKFWEANLQDADLKAILVKDVYPTGKAFLAFKQDKWISALQAGNADIPALRTEMASRYKQHRAAVDSLVQATEKATQMIESETTAMLSTSYLKLFVVSGFCFAVAILINLFMARSINRALGGTAEYAKEIVSHIGSGNLGISVKRDPTDTESIIAATALMRNRIRQAMVHLRESADKIKHYSTQTHANTQQVMRESETQAAAAASIAASVEELSVSIAQMASVGSSAKETAIHSEAMAAEGATVVGRALEAMNSIAAIAKESSHNLNALSESSQQIDQVVSVIHDIADQTNLLALNAAIEAARAGEAGRGFAVVADEVRKLAERTASSTVEISKIVSGLRNGLATSTREMDQGVHMVEEGLALASTAKMAIQEMRDGTLSIAKVVADISNTMAEQSTTSEDIAGQVEKVAAAIQNSLEEVHAAANAAEIMLSVSREFSYSAERFS